MTIQLDNTRKIIAMFGDGGSGKTAYIENLQVLGLNFQQTEESVFTCLHDSVEHIIVTGLGDADFDNEHRQYFERAKFACIFIDCTRDVSVISAGSWISYAREMCGANIPIVLCMNKCMSEYSIINMNNVTNSVNHKQRMRMVYVDHVHQYNADFLFYV